MAAKQTKSTESTGMDHAYLPNQQDMAAYLKNLYANLSLNQYSSVPFK